MGHHFDPVRDVKFRGRPLTKLDRDELLEALVQTLWRVRELENAAENPGFRPQHSPRQTPAATAR